MDAAAVILSLVLALLALSQGRWLALLAFDTAGILFGWDYIPAVFGIIAAANIGYLLWSIRRQHAAGFQPRARSRPTHE